MILDNEYNFRQDSWSFKITNPIDICYIIKPQKTNKLASLKMTHLLTKKYESQFRRRKNN